MYRQQQSRPVSDRPFDPRHEPCSRSAVRLPSRGAERAFPFVRKEVHIRRRIRSSSVPRRVRRLQDWRQQTSDSRRKTSGIRRRSAVRTVRLLAVHTALQRAVRRRRAAENFLAAGRRAEAEPADHRRAERSRERHLAGRRLPAEEASARSVAAVHRVSELAASAHIPSQARSRASARSHRAEQERSVVRAHSTAGRRTMRAFHRKPECSSGRAGEAVGIEVQDCCTPYRVRAQDYCRVSRKAVRRFLVR